MGEQQRVTLPPELIASVKAIASDGDISASGRLTGVLSLIWGWAWFDRQTASWSPSMIALPSAQWLEICGFLTHGVSADAINSVNVGLSFMNSGPSSYTDGSEA